MNNNKFTTKIQLGYVDSKRHVEFALSSQRGSMEMTIRNVMESSVGDTISTKMDEAALKRLRAVIDMTLKCFEKA